MKATLHRAVPPPAIPARRPPVFRPLIGPKRLGASPVTLAVFPATSSAVVTAADARRLLARLDDVSDPPVVVGYNFTRDAVAVLQEAHATLFAASSFWWSDAAGGRSAGGEPDRPGRGAAGVTTSGRGPCFRARPPRGRLPPPSWARPP